jgi:predicted transcriptional regulator with HTH domain
MSNQCVVQFQSARLSGDLRAVHFDPSAPRCGLRVLGKDNEHWPYNREAVLLVLGVARIEQRVAQSTYRVGSICTPGTCLYQSD